MESRAGRSRPTGLFHLLLAGLVQPTRISLSGIDNGRPPARPPWRRQTRHWLWAGCTSIPSARLQSPATGARFQCLLSTHLPLHQPVRQQLQRPAGPALRRLGAVRAMQVGFSLAVQFLRASVDLLPASQGSLDSAPQHSGGAPVPPWRCPPSAPVQFPRPSSPRTPGLHR